MYLWERTIFIASGKAGILSFTRFILVLAMLSIFFNSCTEEMDIPLDESYTRLVVEGSITTDTMAHIVRLTTTTSYYYPEAPPPVEGATVTIFDGIDTIHLNELSSGLYSTDSDYFGIPGRTYSLFIHLKEPVGGYSEYSASSYLHDIPELDSIGLLLHHDWGEQGVWEVKCYVQEPPTVDFYRFLIYKNNKPFTDNIKYWFVTDDKFFNGSYANGAAVSYLRQANPYESLNIGDTIAVEADNISREYYNYILQVQAEVQGPNPMFGGPPANPRGNVSNGAIGFFSAYDLTRRSTITPNF
jgi:hypothetical protein